MLESIDHVGIAVRDLDAAIRFYVDVLGMSLLGRETNQEQGVQEAMLATEPDGQGARVQLLAPVSEQSPVATFLATRGEGVHQVAYLVRDVAAVASTLRERGLRVLYDDAKPGSDGSLVNFVHPRDAGGVLVELVEPSAGDLL